MKTNTSKIVLLIVAVALIGFVSYQATAGFATAVPVPDEVNLWIAGVIFGLVTAGFVWLFEWIGLDLRGLATPISGVLSGWIVGELQNLVNLIPPEFDPYVLIAFRIIVVILSGVGGLYLLAKQRGLGVGKLF